jgi:hypothetical protein
MHAHLPVIGSAIVFSFFSLELLAAIAVAALSRDKKRQGF